jgi:PAS domain-containing protein
VSHPATILPAELAAPEQAGALAEALHRARPGAEAAHQQLSALTNHLREGLLLFDSSRHVVLVNEQLCDFFCLTRPASQWVGRPLDVLTSQVRECMADAAAYDANINNLIERLPAGQHFSSQLSLRDGRIMERDVLRVSLGSGNGWLFTYRDVTDQLAAERARDKQRLFYETVLDELPVEVAVLDENFRYVYANHQAEPDSEKRNWLLDGHTVLEFCERYSYPLSLAKHREQMFRQAEQTEQPVFWDDRTPQPGGDLVPMVKPQFECGRGRLGAGGPPRAPPPRAP